MCQSIFFNLKYGSNPQVISKAKKDINSKFIDMIAQSTLYKQEQALACKLEANYTDIVRNSKYSEE
jgi:hypothetical protein